jgi:hypothetical protein
MRNYLRILLVLPLSIFWLPSQAHAYLDPATGSLVFQSLVAVVAAAGAAISLFWGRLRGLFGKGRKAEAIEGREGDEREDA